MALITDPDQLNDSAADDGSTEVFIDTAAKTIKLVTTGNLSTDGVTMQALYSFLKEEWRNDPHTKNLAAFPFPMVSVTPESFEFVDGWDLLNDTARYLIRTAGWAVRNVSGNVISMWAGIIGLGTIESNDQLYYQQASGASSTNVQLTGQVNQAVQILRDDDGDGNYAEGSDFDRRTYFKLFTREQGQVYGLAKLSDIGVTTLKPEAYRFPISTATDLKITHTDVQIDANSDGTADVAPYTGMSITYYAAAQTRSIGGTNRSFGIIIDGNNGTAEQIYEFVQWSLRKAGDIDADASTLVGKTADELLTFVGDTLKTRSATNPDGGGSGVFIDNYQTVDINRLVFTDNSAVERTFPYVAALTINFGDNLRLDASAKYWVYFTTLPGASNDFGESGALLVDDNTAADMTGSVGGDPLGGSVFAGSYFFLNNVEGWRIRPEAVDHDLVISGNLFGENAATAVFLPTVGDFQVLIRLNTSSLTQQVSTGSGLSTDQATQLAEMWKRFGLDPDNPLVATTSAITAGAGLAIALTGDGVTTSTATRQP